MQQDKRTNQRHQKPVDYLPFDTTEALPLPDVAFLSKGDIVRYERLNERGEVVMFAEGKVINLNYHAQKVHIRIASTIRFWVDVKNISLVTVAANLAAEAA